MTFACGTCCRCGENFAGKLDLTSFGHWCGTGICEQVIEYCATGIGVSNIYVSIEPAIRQRQSLESYLRVSCIPERRSFYSRLSHPLEDDSCGGWVAEFKNGLALEVGSSRQVRFIHRFWPYVKRSACMC